jgi:hypothetical protein
MGILFVLAFWGIVGLVLAAFGTLGGRTIVAKLTRGANEDAHKSARDKIIRYATLFPVGCLVWAACVFVFQGFINTTYLHRDIGIGDSSYCPLPNGYSILMIDVGDEGTVCRGTDASESNPDSAISGVRELQVSGAFILGASDSQYAEHFGQDVPTLNRYFLLDTRTGKHSDFATEVALRMAASELGITVKLEPIFNVYRRYRFTWFDAFAAALLFVPPIIGIVLLIRSIVRLRGMNFSSRSDVLPAN